MSGYYASDTLVYSISLTPPVGHTSAICTGVASLVTGDDVIQALAGDDMLIGGAGNDVCLVDGFDTISETSLHGLDTGARTRFRP